jgi:hypothetical protein
LDVVPKVVITAVEFMGFFYTLKGFNATFTLPAYENESIGFS